MNSTEEPTKLISQQPQLNGYHLEPTSTSCGQKTVTRKPRGIFTTTSSRLIPTHSSSEEYLAAGDSGLVQTSIRDTNEAQRLIPSVHPKEEPIEENRVAPSTSADEENQSNCKQGNSEVDNIVGNYQVNPLDGSLIKIPVEQTEYIKTYLEYERKPNNGRESSSNENHSVVENDNFTLNSDTHTRRKYRKRKYKDMYDDEDCTTNTLVKHPAGIPKPTGDKAEEVLKAAKSLFSKRTRTLYHWLYPSTSKLELKNIVLSAWDTLQESEKHFYISQVLGRFGFPASNLMVNPQIGGLQGMPTDHLRGNVSGTINLNSVPNSGEEGTISNTKRVVEELLANETEDEWNIASRTSRITAERKYKRRKYSSRTSLMENESDSAAGNMEEDNSTHFEDDDEFQNDPELSKELAAFKMQANADDNEEADEVEIFENF